MEQSLTALSDESQRKGKERSVGRQTLTVAEAAAELGLSPHALWQQLYRGRFPHRRWGKKVVILRDEMAAFLRTLPGTTAEEAVEKALQGGAE